LRLTLAKLLGWFTRDRSDRDSDQELRIHLDLLAERFVRQGMTLEEASYAANRQFGGTAKVKRDLHESRGFWQLETLIQDVRYAIRSLHKTPIFTLTAVGALAIGIGANTAIFSVVDKVLLQPLTYPDPGRIVLFFVTTPDGPSWGGSAAKFNVWRRQTHVFQDVAAYEYRGSNLNLTSGPIPEQIHTIRVTADYFPLFGAQIVQGRPFTADEDRPSGGHFAVISYALWQRQFGGDPQMTGKAISLDNTPYEVVGVLAPTFNTELDSPPDAFLPFQIDPNSADHAQYFNVVGRLKPGVTTAAANAQLQLAANNFRQRFPNIMGARDGFGIVPFQDAVVSGARSPLGVLTGAVIFVLLIACANVANLLLVRATSRKREIAVRSAMGASRVRLIRQLLTESIVLSIVGGALGLILGFLGVRALLAMNPGDIPRIGQHGAAVTMDWRVLVFTVVISLATGVVFGLIPAIGASREDLSITLKDGSGRSGTSRRLNRTRSLLVVGELALALVLLVGSGLLIRTFVELRTINPGFDAHNVLTMRMSLAGSRFAKTSDVARVVRHATRQLESMPGVVRACASYNFPLEGAFGIPFNIVGRTPAHGRYDGRGWLTVSPGYFEIFKIPALQGRLFNNRDDASADRVAIINEAMARKYWPKGDAVGNRVILGKGYGPEFEEPARQIVGVVGDVRDFGLNRDPQPVVYVPLAQVTDGITALSERAASLAWVVRTRVKSHSLRAAIEDELRRDTGGLPVTAIRSMNEVVAQSTAGAGFQMTLLTIFAGAALLLAAIGIYGLMAYSVQQRTHEIGIRLALGAEPGHVRKLLILQGLRLASIGVAIGVVAAFGLARLLSASLFGVESWDPFTFITVPVLLIVVVLFAIWLPTRRATRVDPVVALRYE
jgi:predicted permease